MNLRTRKPTGRVPHPVILLEGGEKTGKSWACAEMSASDKVGRTFWLDIGEGSADEYGAVNGADYDVVEHDGSWGQIVQAVRAIREEARRAERDGENPTLLVIDSMSAEWEVLKDWAHQRARESKTGKRRLQEDPNAEVPVPIGTWNDAGEMHRQLMTMLLTFPGIVVMTARGKEVVAFDENGRPKEGVRDYRVEGHKSLAYDASAWVRLSREGHPMVVGMRSVHAGVRPGVDKPTRMRAFSLEKLIFEHMRYDPAASHVRNLPTGEADEARQRLRKWASAADLDLIEVAKDYAEQYGVSLRQETRVDPIDAFLAHLQEVHADAKAAAEAIETRAAA